MSVKADQLAPLSHFVCIPGVKQITDVDLEFDPLDDDVLYRTGVYLARDARSKPWHYGSWLAKYCINRLSKEDKALQDEAKRDPRMFEAMCKRYTNERANLTDVAVATLNQYRLTAQFYNPSSRLPELSNAHHQEAMDGSGGDLAVAQEWLQRAIDNNWTTPQLRAAIRQAKRQQADPDEPMVEHTQAELFACARWARTTTKRVADMDEEEARQLYVDLQPILTLAEQLSARLGGKPAVALGRPMHD